MREFYSFSKLCLILSILTLGSCQKDCEQSTQSLTRQSASTAEDAVTKPGIYEQTYIVQDKEYKVDVKYYKNSEGNMVVEPVLNSKDIDELKKVVNGKEYSVMEAPQSFGTYILYDAKTESKDKVEASFKQFLLPKVEANIAMEQQMKVKGDQATTVAPQSSTIWYDYGTFILWGRQSGPTKTIRWNYNYVTFYDDVNAGGLSYPVSALKNNDNPNGPYGETRSDYADAVLQKAYIGNAMNDRVSSVVVGFNDAQGLPAGMYVSTPKYINVEMYEDANFQGHEYTLSFVKPANVATLQTVNINNITMWTQWFWFIKIRTYYWNDQLSSFKVRFMDY